MKVLLLSVPYLTDFMRNARCDYVSLAAAQYYPMWLSYAGALLEKHGHQVKLIDGPAQKLTKEGAMAQAKVFQPDLTAVYSSTKSQSSDIEFSQNLKSATQTRLVFVGPFVSADPTSIFEEGGTVDCAIIREFDYPLLELAEGVTFSKIKNLLYRSNGKLKINPIRPLLTTKELDAIPYVSDFYQRHLDIKNYRVPQQLYPHIDIVTGRGCIWGRCTFCLWVHTLTPGSVYNTRSLENVISEIKFIKTNLPEIKEIFFQDDILGPQRARELSQTLLAEKIDIPWTCYCKGGTYDQQTLKLMEKAGCRLLHIGYESANQQILVNIKKGAHISIYEKFNRLVEKTKIKIHADFIFGLPGETRETMQQTLNWAKKQKAITTAQFEIANTFKNVPLYEQLKAEGNLEDGEPSYPHLHRDEIRSFAKKAFAKFYFRPQYIWYLLSNPKDLLIPHIRSMIAMLKSIFLKRWVVGGGWEKPASSGVK